MRHQSLALPGIQTKGRQLKIQASQEKTVIFVSVIFSTEVTGPKRNIMMDLLILSCIKEEEKG